MRRKSDHTVEEGRNASVQMTLGDLIAALEAMDPLSMVANLGNAHSYRGYYRDLAFERIEAVREAGDLLEECLSAMGQVFHGYKGGNYKMDAQTPVWVADYGYSGYRLVGIGEYLKLASDEW